MSIDIPAKKKGLKNTIRKIISKTGIAASTSKPAETAPATILDKTDNIPLGWKMDWTSDKRSPAGKLIKKVHKQASLKKPEKK